MQRTDQKIVYILPNLSNTVFNMVVILSKVKYTLDKATRNVPVLASMLECQFFFLEFEFSDTIPILSSLLLYSFLFFFFLDNESFLFSNLHYNVLNFDTMLGCSFEYSELNVINLFEAKYPLQLGKLACLSKSNFSTLF